MRGRTAARGLPALALALALAATIAGRGGGAAPQPPQPIPRQGVLGTYLRGPRQLLPGSPAALRVATHWATAPDAVTPLSGVSVTVRLEGPGGRAAELYRGVSSDSGIADAAFTVPRWPAGRYALLVTSRLGPHAESSRHEVELQHGARLLLQSDKPLYQPGQTVHLRAMCLRPLDGKPAEAPGAAVLFELYDPRGNRVLQERRPLSPFGLSSVDAPLSSELLLGAYRAHAQLVGDDAPSADLELEVARYVLPRFQVTLEPDRPYYGPGDRVRLQLRGRYFHGRALGGGEASVRVSLHGAGAGLGRPLATLRGPLDAQGGATLELTLPRDLEAGALHLAAEVSDTAEHVERAARQVPVARQALEAEISAEAGHLLPGLDNEVFVVAARPDGAAEAGARVTLTANGAALPPQEADALGVATFRLRPPKAPAAAPAAARPRAERCGAREVALLATVVARGGARIERGACLKVADAGGLLLRTDRTIYPRGAPIAVRIEAPGRQGVAYVDLVKDRQIVSTAAVPLRGGVGEALLPADDRRFGTLALQAYHIGPGGERATDARLVYAERKAALRVEVEAPPPQGQDSFRPGDTGRLRLRVLDAETGAGVPAALGLVMVDEALLALRPLRPGASRAYFALTQEARRAAESRRARPAGRTISQLVEEDDLDEPRRQEAARVLLAGAAPPWDLGWERDPWALRRQRQAEIEERLKQAFPRYAAAHIVGERGPAGWDYLRDLPALMARDGALPRRDSRDAWERPIETEELVRLASLPPFADQARQQLDDRLTALYGLLIADQKAGRLAPDPTTPRAHVITAADLERLVSEGRVARGRLLDPWGRPLRVAERRRPVDIYGLRSRFVLATAGPDGAAGGADDLYAADLTCHSVGCGEGFRVQGAPAAEAFADRTRMGCGCGVGYGAAGGALAGHRASTPAVRMGTAELRGTLAGKEDRVRSSFPETLLWAPELLTDAQGRAEVDLAFADSITTWRLQAEAVDRDGRLGVASAAVRVTQDFFADLDLPPALTQHDEIAVPVTVSNYLPGPQRVTLELEAAPWYAALSEAQQVLDLAPGQVAARQFRIRALGVGRQALRVRARGQGAAGAADTVERGVEVTPDGVERLVSFQDRIGAGAARHALQIPGDAVAGGSAVSLKVYPTLATHVVEGLDSLLRVPSGCFEQTSSTTYPNALILRYLRQTGRSTPDIERRARAYLQTGYQRLLSFEVRSGGFSWFGEAPASQVLTAYGLEEFHDMAKVMPIDERVIDRTRGWLLRQQRQDGSFAPDTHVIDDGVTQGLKDVLRVTAFIAVSLQRSGFDGPQLQRARAYARRALSDGAPADPFTLALLAELLPGERAGLLERLWAARRERGEAVSFAPTERTATYGGGQGGVIETTALAARALLERQPARAERAVAHLLGNKDALGNWFSTQATIRTLQVLLLQDQRAARGRGALEVAVDGRPAGRVLFDGRDALQVLDLPAAATGGAHEVSLRFAGEGKLAYQLVGRYYEPQAAAPAVSAADLLDREPAGKAGGTPGAPPPPELSVRMLLESDRVSVGEALQAQAVVRWRGAAALEMPMVTVGLPPGFDVDREALDALVRQRTIEKYEVGTRAVVLYLERLLRGVSSLPLRLVARVPARVQVPPPVVYAYYEPERRAVGAPQLVAVAAPSAAGADRR